MNDLFDELLERLVVYPGALLRKFFFNNSKVKFSELLKDKIFLNVILSLLSYGLVFFVFQKII